MVAGIFFCGRDCSYGDIFRFTDARGTIHFVDDASKAPRHIRRRPHLRTSQKPLPGALTKIIIKDNRILVPATLRSNERETKIVLLLDTGATATAILPSAAKRLAITPDKSAETAWEVVGGGTISGQRITVDSLIVGPHTREKIDIDVLPHQGEPPPYDGYLGMDFLGGVTYHIDFAHSVIRWTTPN